VVGTLIAVACAWSSFVLGWWISACLCLFLVALQYWCTNKAAKLAFNWKMRPRKAAASADTRT